MLQKNQLHEYQQRLVDRIYEHDHTIAVVPMGGGKTVSTLTAFQELQRGGIVKRAFVFAPKRVALSVWPREAELWEHLKHLRVSVIAGSPTQRLKAVQADADIYVINFENVKWLMETHGPLAPDTLAIVDELSRLKNPSGQQAKTVAKLIAPCRMRVGLTGTPMPSGHLDLYQQVKVIHGDAVWNEPFYKWRNRYFESDYMGYVWTAHPAWRDKLEDTFAALSVTITEDDLASVHIEPVIVDHKIMLPKNVISLHDDALKHWMIDHGGDDPLRMLLANAAVGSGKARQIVSGMVYDENKTAHLIHTEKLDQLDDIIVEAGEPVIVVYEFKFELDQLKERYPDLNYIGAGVSDRKAADAIEQWNAGKLPILALHPQSAGHGLNLQVGGRRMVWLNLPWSNEIYQQTIARIARQGQKLTVFVHRLIAQDTVEEIIVLPRLGGRAVDENRLKEKITKLIP